MSDEAYRELNKKIGDARNKKIDTGKLLEQLGTESNNMTGEQYKQNCQEWDEEFKAIETEIAEEKKENAYKEMLADITAQKG